MAWGCRDPLSHDGRVANQGCGDLLLCFLLIGFYISFPRMWTLPIYFLSAPRWRTVHFFESQIPNPKPQAPWLRGRVAPHLCKGQSTVYRADMPDRHTGSDGINPIGRVGRESAVSTQDKWRKWEADREWRGEREREKKSTKGYRILRLAVGGGSRLHCRSEGGFTASLRQALYIANSTHTSIS